MAGAPADKQKMLREHIEAGDELDRWAIPRAEDGETIRLPERVAILAGRYHDEQQRRIELERLRDVHVPDFPPEDGPGMPGNKR